MKPLSYCLLCILFLFVYPLGAQIGTYTPETVTLEEMPDAAVNPGLYAEWKSAYARSLRSIPSGVRREMDHTITNNWVACIVDETTGEFDQGGNGTGSGSTGSTTGYVDITYSWPNTPGTEWHIYWVDGHEGKTASTMPNASSHWIDGDGVVNHVWNNWNGVRIHQKLKCVALGATRGDNEQVKFETFMTPADGSCHEVGCLVYYDTKINANDGCPISTSFGYTGTATIFYAPSLPTIWRAYEGGSPPTFSGLKTLGILTGFEAVEPDVFWYGRWPSSTGNNWADSDWITDTGGTLGSDSAAMVKWYGRTVCPGDTIRYCTYYGIGELEGTGITLMHTPPTFTSSCVGVSPNPAPITAMITNAGVSTATGVTATLDLSGTPLTMAGTGTPNPYSIGSIAGYGGSVIADWYVNIPPSAYGTTQCYDIRVNYNPSRVEEETYCISIPAAVSLNLSVYADDYELCSPECTQLHAVVSGSAPGPYSYSWTPVTGLDDPTSPNPNACPTSAITYTCTVTSTTSPDCYDTQSLTIESGEGAPFEINNEAICFGESATLTPSISPSGATYLWSNRATTRTITVSPTSTTEYWCEICVGSCCSADTAQVIVSPELIVNPGEDVFICDGDSVILGGAPTVSGGIRPMCIWSPPAGLSNPTIPNPIASPSVTTTYTVTVTDSLGCYASDYVTVEVGYVTEAPDLVFPPDGTVELPPATVILDWDPVSEPGVTYSLYIDGSLYATGLSETEFMYPISCDQHHEWYVVATNGCGDSEPSETWSFSTMISPSAPELVYPANGTTNMEPGDITLSWDAPTEGSDPITYDVYVNGELIAEGISETEFDYEIYCNTDYEWYVVVHNICTENMSAAWTFYTIPAPSNPLLISPLNGEIVELDDVDLIWHASTGGEPLEYTVYINDSEYETGITDTFINVPVICDSIYYWYVTVSNPCSTVSSETWSYYAPRTPSRPIIIAPSDSDILSLPGTIFTWNTVSGTEPITYNTYVNGELISSTPDTFLLWDIECDTSYTFYVEAENCCGPVASETITVYSPDSPTAPVNVFPEDEAIVEVGTNELIWSPASGSEPIYYDVFVNGNLFAPGLIDTTFPIDVYCDSSFAWYVIAYNMCDSAVSSETGFAGPDCGNPELTLIEPLDGTWSACADQAIIVGVDDIVDIDVSSIRIRVNDVPYTISDPELTYDDGELRFTPSTLWTDAMEISFCVDTLVNIYGIYAEPFCSSFRVDLTAPRVISYIPTASVVTDPAEPVIIEIVDGLSGVDHSTVSITINGTSYLIDDIEWEYVEDTILVLDLTSHPDFEHNSTIEVCILADDSPDYCAANHLEECYEFDVDLVGPIASSPMTSGSIIEDGYIISCDYHGFCFQLDDSPESWGVDISTIVLDVNGETYDIDSPELSYDATETELCFDPEGLYSDGSTIEVSLVAANDNNGNPLSEEFSFTYIIDMSTPHISGTIPEDGAYERELEPMVSFTLSDDISGVYYDDTEICISVSGGSPLCIDESHPAVSLIGEEYQIDFSVLGLDLVGGNAVQVCVNAIDQPDICDPNEMDTCWTFHIPAGGPTGVIVEPLNGTYSACDVQSIIMRVFDAYDEIDESTIELSVNGTVYTTTDSELNFTLPDNLVFTPSSMWSDGEVVSVSLLSCDDVLGNHLTDAPISWSFTIDLTAPVLSSLTPLPETFISDLCPVMSFNLADALSGLNESSVVIDINSTTASLASPLVDWTAGVATISICDFDADIVGGDDINISVYAEDSPDYCDPNILDTTFVYHIPDGGPIAEIITPGIDSIISPCDPQEIRITLIDPEGDEILDTTIVFCVNDVCYSLEDDQLYWDGDELVFNGGEGYFTHGEYITVELRAAFDELLNPLATPLEWSFTVDYEAPVINFTYPGDGMGVSDISPTITIDITDDVAGVDWSTLTITIDGVTYDITDPAITISGDELSFDPDVHDIEWTGGDVIDISLSVNDSTTEGYCEPNLGTADFTFSISSGGPIGTIISPTGDTYVACNPVEILMTLVDPEGDEIDESTIIFVVEDVEYTIDDPELTYADETLTFIAPEDFFINGQTVDVELRACDDVLRNHLDEIVTWSFIIDYEAPTYSAFVPADGSAIPETAPDISVDIADALSGVNPDCVELEINGVLHAIGDEGVYWDGTTFEFRPSEIDVSWTGGESVELTIYACDSPDYCGPNTSSYEWDFFIPTGGPIPNAIEPLDETISTCEDQPIILQITDSDGVDASSIRFTVNGIEYTVDDDELEYTGDRLIFTPPAGFYSHGDVVNCALTEVYDMLGNIGDLLPYEWSFTIDYQGPQYSNATPVDRSIHIGPNGWQTPISVEITDDVLGVLEDSLKIRINGIYRAPGIVEFDLLDAGVTYTAGILSIDPQLVDESSFGITYLPEESHLTGTGLYFPEGQTIDIEVISTENYPDYCDAHITNLVWQINIEDDDIIPPTIDIESPEYVSTQTPFNISVLATDTSDIHIEETTYQARLIWDDDGEVDVDFDGTRLLAFDPGTDGGVWTNPDGSITRRLTTVTELPGIVNPTDITVGISVNDEDYDFLNSNDRTLGYHIDTIRIMDGPDAEILHPTPDQITTCADQSIIVQLIDEDGINESTIVLNVAGIDYPISHDWMSFDSGTNQILFDPDENIFTNEQHVIGYITLVEDNLGNPMWDTMFFDFYVDLEAPVYSNEYPMDSMMVQELQPDISITIDDNLAGVRPEDLSIIVNEVNYDYPNIALDWNGNVFTFIPENAGVKFVAGDTVKVRVVSADDPDIDDCSNNESSTEWWFVIEPNITCSVQPNPFTPNDDRYNDMALFHYPFMFSSTAELEIYTRRSQLVFTSKMEDIDSYEEISTHIWDGKDNNGKKLAPGLYLYIIKKDGEVICQGTITLVR